MKKPYTLLAILFCFSFCMNAQIVSIPDASFKTKLIALGVDTNNDGQIQNTEALAQTNLNLSNSTISDLTGIASFSNLQILQCINNYLTSIDATALSNLQVLRCSNNQLSTLNVSGLTNLMQLECQSNNLISLYANGLMSLQKLNCSFNQLTSLDINVTTNLQELYCNDNQLSSLSVSGMANLHYLYCGNNELSSLNLIGLTTLIELDCGNNLLTSLNTSDLIGVQLLLCDNNQLSTLDLSNINSAQIVVCNDNQLTSLFIKNGVNESINFSNNINLNYVCADDSQIDTIQNKIVQYGYSNCSASSYCSFTPGGNFYTIQGTSRYDSNNDGCSISDAVCANLKYSIASGTNSGFLYSNSSGNFTIPVQSGTHTITPIILENLNYFNISPASLAISFPTQASPFTQNFCFTANGVHDDLEVSIMPMLPARPGFDALYKIIYKNNGTQSQSGTVDLTFDDAVLDYVSSVPSFTTQTIGNLSFGFTNLEPFETREINLTFNVNSPTEIPSVNANDILNYSVTITGLPDETPTDNVSNLNQVVVNSFDPNDKTCLEGASISPAQVGKYVHYLIRFENTGTFPAQNIVVKDIIDTTKFDVSTLVPVSSSHSMVTRITQTNKVEFIFENINLPFDDANNDGYVAFKIKTKPNLVVGSTFSNSANIYFDYNYPIQTNNYSTTVTALSNQDFEFSDYLTLFPNPVKDLLNLEKKQTIEITSINVYNALGQLLMVVTKPSDTIINVSNLPSGIYYLNAITDKGNSNLKFIKE